MEPASAEKIIIRDEELRTPHVDEQLARQLSFGMAPARVEDAKTTLLQRPWFALMLAGGLGALAGWAAMEPFLEDGIGLRGTLSEVHLREDARLIATVRVGDELVLVAREARIHDGRGPVSIDQLAPGMGVYVLGELIENGALVAFEVRVLGPGPPPPRQEIRGIVLRHELISYLFFAVVAALVGLFVGATDGVLSHALQRSMVCGLVGLAIGLALGLVSSVVAELVYAFTRHLVARFHTSAGDLSTVGFLIQMITRGIAWSLAGAAVGLGQGVALRSKKLALNGLVGGMVGALIGGLLFDPIDRLVHDSSFHSAALSRAVGLAVIGTVTGLMIGIVELLAREAWVKMLTGPLAGKEFVLYKNPTLIGSSPKSDIYLFKDAEVEPTHAELRTVGEGYELADRSTPSGTFLNGRRVTRQRLQSGDQVRIGKTVFNFTEKEA